MSSEVPLLGAEVFRKGIRSQLLLTSQRVVLRPLDGSGSAEVSVPYALLSAVQASKAPRTLLRLKIEGQGEIKVKFHGDEARQELDQAKEILNRKRSAASVQPKKRSGSASASHSATSSADKTVDVDGVVADLPSATTDSNLSKKGVSASASVEDTLRQRRLAADSSLMSSYKEMVVAGLVSDSDFWRVHRDAAEGTPLTVQQNSTKGRAKNARSTKISLTPQKIHEIFVAEPEVFGAYKEKVPHEMSEEDFWKEYVRSAYYHRFRSKETSEEREAGQAPEQKRADVAESSVIVSDASWDLISTFGDYRHGERERDEPSGASDKLSQLGFNASVPAPQVEQQTKDDDALRHAAIERAKEHFEMPELMEDPTDRSTAKDVPLHLRNHQGERKALSRSRDSATATDVGNKSEVTSSLVQAAHDVGDSLAVVQESMQPQGRSWLERLSASYTASETAMGFDGHSKAMLYSDDTLDQIRRQHFRRACEYLRHYYAQLRIPGEQAKTKARRLLEALKKLKAKVTDIRDTWRKSGDSRSAMRAQVLQPLIGCISVAEGRSEQLKRKLSVAESGDNAKRIRT